MSQTIEDKKKIINKINRNQNQQIAAKKKNVSTGITGVFWGTKASFKRQDIYRGVWVMHATCHSLLYSHGIWGGKNKNITHHQGEMYIVIQEQNDLK